jgi:hypothetical protein
MISAGGQEYMHLVMGSSKCVHVHRETLPPQIVESHCVFSISETKSKQDS